ncbi:hypothetical protein [Streptomyces sp. NPDC058867]|uniref:hypothetical protein n=1 Tax=unclassified Streptomyces TaxID=2593676 RepID=UPI0036A60750
MPDATSPAPATGAGRKLAAFVLGLAALVTVMLCAFALPSVHSGPHEVPVGAAGPAQFTQALEAKLGDDEWDVRVYEDADAIAAAVHDRDITGGVALASEGIDVYVASAGGSTTAAAVTTLGNTLAAQQHTEATVHDLVPFTEDDPRGSGLTAAAMPIVFGGILPVVALSTLFPGRAGLRTRLLGVLLYAVAAGAAITALLQFGTGSLDGGYGVTSLGLALGITALSGTMLGLHALWGMPGFALGGAVVMFLGNPLSGLPTGPHWLPSGWAELGQLLPPGATGSLLRANAYFDGTGAMTPVLVLSAWVLLALCLAALAGRRRAGRTGTPAPVTASPEEAVV